MRNVNSKRALVAASALSLVVGAGGAVAASKGSPSRGDGFLARVASHLGISTEKLEDATKAAAIDQVNADLKAGRITKAEADALKAQIEKGDVPFFYGGPKRFFGPPRLDEEYEHAAPFLAHDPFSSAADYLGLTVPQLMTKLANGQTMAQIAKAKDKSVDGLKQAIRDGVKKDLDKAVEDGYLTEDQAKEKLDAFESKLDDLVNGTFPGPGEGPRFHFKWRQGPPDSGGWRMPPAA
jgi:hypothetical protein